MRQFARLSIATLLGCFVMEPASAQSTTARDQPCRLRIDRPVASWVIDGYDPFSGNAPTGTFEVIFVNEGSGECRFRPFFQTDVSVPGMTGDGGTRVLYTLLDTYGQYDATPLGGRTVRRVTNPPVVLPPNSQQVVRYILNIDPATVRGDGLFSQQTMLQAEATDGSLIASRQFTLGVRVRPTATMTLAGAFSRVNGEADINLGELQPGVAKVPLQLHIRSTRAYRLEVSSLNSGNLRLGGTAWTIPYSLALKGQTLGNGSPAAYTSHQRAGFQIEWLPVTFVIGDTAQRRAGTYSDVITLSLSVL